jgi:hypothetical protein
MEPTAADVLAVVSQEPGKVGDLGLRLVATHGVDVTKAQGQPIGKFLAAQGLSLSALQKVVDDLVRDGKVTELRGRALWDQYFPGLPANAKGRYFLTP